MRTALWISLAVLLPVGALVAWQLAQAAAEERDTTDTAEALLSRAGPRTGTYAPSLVAGLPEPARRFFEFAIRPGTPLDTTAEITMAGELSLGTRDKPGSLQMHARQVLAAPHGFTWSVTAGEGLMR